MLKYKKYNDFVNEVIQLDENDGVIFIVDVQKEFGDFIPKNMVSELYEYCKDFDEVYQIWDSNEAKKPTFKFPNQVKSIKKKFGKKFLDKKIQNKLKKLTSKKSEGEYVELKGVDGYFVRIENNHDWFLVSDELLEIFRKLKNKKVIITGGADQECLKDLYVAGETFGIKFIYNHNFIYSSETKQKQNYIEKQN